MRNPCSHKAMIALNCICTTCVSEQVANLTTAACVRLAAVACYLARGLALTVLGAGPGLFCYVCPCDESSVTRRW